MKTEFNFSPSFHHHHLLALTRIRARLTEMLGFGDEERVPLAPLTLWKKEHTLSIP